MKKSLVILIVAALVLAMSFTVVSFAVDDSQVLVAKDYFDKIVATLATKEYVDEKAKTGGSGADSYVACGPYSKGTVLVGGESTEMILRSGTAVAYIPKDAGGGIADLTSGSDITDGKSLSRNHLLLFARDDGRAMKITSDNVYVMIKGSYTVQ